MNSRQLRDVLRARLSARRDLLAVQLAAKSQCKVKAVNQLVDAFMDELVEAAQDVLSEGDVFYIPRVFSLKPRFMDQGHLGFRVSLDATFADRVRRGLIERGLWGEGSELSRIEALRVREKPLGTHRESVPTAVSAGARSD